MNELIELLRTLNHSLTGIGLGPVCDAAADEIERLTAERDALIIQAAKFTSERYPFVHIRMDASEAEKEGAIREKMIELGWTPP